MTMSVIEPVLRSALIATGCCTCDVPARWESGVAQAVLVMKFWGVALPEHLIAVLPQHVLRHLALPSPAALDAPTPFYQVDPAVKHDVACEDSVPPCED